MRQVRALLRTDQRHRRIAVVELSPTAEPVCSALLLHRTAVNAGRGPLVNQGTIGALLAPPTVPLTTFEDSPTVPSGRHPDKSAAAGARTGAGER